MHIRNHCKEFKIIVTERDRVECPQ